MAFKETTGTTAVDLTGIFGHSDIHVELYEDSESCFFVFFYTTDMVQKGNDFLA